MMKTRTNKAITMEVLTGAYTANIGTGNEHINSQYLCDAIALEMVNDFRTITEVRENTRRTIESICWGAFIQHASNMVGWYYDGYVATSEHLKAYIKNDYSVLAPLYEEMKAEREEYQEELRAEKEAQKEENKKFGITKKEAEKRFKESFENWADFKKLDSVAKSEEWSYFTDMLCKDGEITEWQYNNWLNPGFCK